jgi:hypothetical protein
LYFPWLETLRAMRGENEPKRLESATMPPFSGGVSQHSNGGYLKITAGPLRDCFVHLIVAEAKIGRPLRKDEHCHHANGDVKDCRPANLIVLGEDVHNAVSRKQYWYLKQKYSREEAAWAAFFDVTGKTPTEFDASFDPAGFAEV